MSPTTRTRRRHRRTPEDVRARFLASGGEDGLIERLELQYGGEPHHVDVLRWADWAVDFRKRKVVGNLSGLLVTKVREVATANSPHVPHSQEAQRVQAEQYAAYHVQLYQIVAEQHLTPGQIAEQLERGRREGFPMLNPVLIDRLRMLGDRWPGS